MFRPQAIYRTPSPPFDKSTSRVRVKIDGLRLVGGNPDFTNAPGRRRRRTLLRPAASLRTRWRGIAPPSLYRALGAIAPPKPELTIYSICSMARGGCAPSGTALWASYSQYMRWSL